MEKWHRRRTIFSASLLLSLLMAASCSSSSKTSSASKTTAASRTTTTTAPPKDTGPAVPSAGCQPASSSNAAADRALTADKRTIDVDGTQREFLLTAPANNSPSPQALPLVVDFHGLGEGDAVHVKMTEFGALGQKEGFVVATPQGTGTPFAHWQTNSTVSPNPDVDFVTKLLESVEGELCIDTSRVYATGLSYGAFMTSFVACFMSNRFAAFAPVAGLQMNDPCPTTRPVPILTFHGTQDPILLFNGGINGAGLSAAFSGQSPAPVPPGDINGPGYPATAADWAAKDGCAKKFTDTRTSAHVVHRVWKCPEGVAVEMYIVEGGGHAWPGSQFSASIAKVVGQTTMEINATQTIWDFFRRFRLSS